VSAVEALDRLNAAVDGHPSLRALWEAIVEAIRRLLP
jgi:hypothetical protein